MVEVGDEAGIDSDAGTLDDEVPGGAQPPRFHILERLGNGGCGVVYRARDNLLKRDVAIKCLTSGDDEQARELVREAQAQARVEHPHVCKIYEIFSMKGRPAISMQLVPGRTLRDATKGLSAREKASLVAAIADGVEAAHRLGIIHRDLKPSNVLCERTGSGELHPYVTDFGLARELGATLTGRQVGTPAYMAPEQARGESEAIGPATDVYGLGGTLYAVLCGKPPNAGRTVAEILAGAEQMAPEPLRKLDPTLPRELEIICARCLEKEPSRRYPSAQALAEDLRRYVAGEAIKARPRSLASRLLGWASRRRAIAGSVAAILAAALVAAIVVARRGLAGWTPAIRTLGPAYDEWAGRVSIAPDGRELVYASNRDGHWRIYAETLSADLVPGSPRALTPEDMLVYSPEIARDGGSVLCVLDHGTETAVARLPRDGGTPVIIAEGADDVTHCGDGRLLLHYTSSPGCFDCERLVLRGPDGAERVLMKSAPVEYLDAGGCDAAGRTMVFRLRRIGSRNTQLGLVDLASGRVQRIGEPIVKAEGERLHPDGRSILFHTANHELLEMSLSGAVHPIALGMGAEWALPSSDGRLLFYLQMQPDVPITARTSDGTTRRLTLAMENVRSMDIAPDGREMAFVTMREGESELIVISTADGTWRRIASDALHTAISRDGHDVFFLRGQGAATELWSVPMRGGEPRRLYALAGAIALARASDGLHATLLVGDRYEAWRLPPEGVAAREAAEPILMVLPSPDGSHVLMRRSPGAVVQPDLVVPAGAAPDDARARSIPWTRSQWAADGTLVGMDDHTLRRLDLTTGAVTEVMKVPEASRYVVWLLSPDGKTVYLSQLQNHTRRMVMTNFGDRPRP